ncbi:MAG: MTH938/NDUFAF3 family protein [Candidatus Pacearchaeota archaeon]|nr:MTH938/NDUFAF3 family protein [Candidatus Pacearchaeota archaeon]
MPKVDFYEFGIIAIDGKKYEKDIIILPSGRIIPRPMPKGTHTICFSEFEKILEEKPEVIIIGTGHDGIAKLEEEANNKLKSLNIKIVKDITKKAVEIYNKTKEKKAALFHLTC